MSECIFKNNCPYLNNRSVSEVLSENDYWKRRVEYMEGIMKLAQEKILKLESEKNKLLEEKHSLEQELSEAYRKPFKPSLNKNEGVGKIKKKRGAPIGHAGMTGNVK